MSTFRNEGDIVIGGAGRTGGTLIQKIDPPIIEISGGGTTELFQEKKVYQRSDGKWRRQPVREFSGHVDIKIRNPGYKPGWESKPLHYPKDTDTIKVGNKNDGYRSQLDRGKSRAANPVAPLVFNQTFETYFSLNGKTPKKSKNNLYTHVVRLKSNQTSTTTTVIRAVNYINGRKSSETTAEISILKTGRVASSPLKRF